MPNPTPFGQNLEHRYGIWYQAHPTTYLTGEQNQSNAGDFMKATFPEKYQDRSRDTARRAFNKITAGETTGRNINYYQPKKYVVPRSYRAAPPKAIRGEYNYRVDVYYYNDEESYKQAVRTDGEINQFSVARTFNMSGHKKLSRGPDWLLVQELADAKTEEWEEGSPPYGANTTQHLTDFQWRRLEVTLVPAIFTTENIIDLDNYDLG